MSPENGNLATTLSAISTRPLPTDSATTRGKIASIVYDVLGTFFPKNTENQNDTLSPDISRKFDQHMNELLYMVKGNCTVSKGDENSLIITTFTIDGVEFKIAHMPDKNRSGKSIRFQTLPGGIWNIYTGENPHSINVLAKIMESLRKPTGSRGTVLLKTS